MTKKFYVVIGGSHGIGLGIVNRLIASDAHVTAISRTAGGLAEHPGLVHRAIDVTRDTIASDQLPEHIDGFVYCPGSIRLGPIRSLDPQTLLDDYALNVVGAVRCLQSALSGMKKAGSSSMVLFSTVAVSQGLPMHAAVAASKGAVEALTRTLAAELSPNIRVNCIAPSLTDTRLAEKLLADNRKRDAMAQRHPLKRVGNVDDIADTAEFLLSDKSSWITGQVIGVDGGMSTLRA